MSVPFTNWTSRVAIAGRIAERRRQPQDWDETATSGDYHLPFGRTAASAEAARWLWQPVIA
jgi:hypothetical protein